MKDSNLRSGTGHSSPQYGVDHRGFDLIQGFNHPGWAASTLYYIACTCLVVGCWGNNNVIHCNKYRINYNQYTINQYTRYNKPKHDTLLNAQENISQIGLISHPRPPSGGRGLPLPPRSHPPSPPISGTSVAGRVE
jgi:hypothetical protein